MKSKMIFWTVKKDTQKSAMFLFWWKFLFTPPSIYWWWWMEKLWWKKNVCSSCENNTVFRWINTLGTEAENEPLSLSDFNETHSVYFEYRNFMCWKYDSDQLKSTWDMASQSQKSGPRLFKQVHLYAVKTVIWSEIHDGYQFGTRMVHDWMKNCDLTQWYTGVLNHPLNNGTNHPENRHLW